MLAVSRIKIDAVNVRERYLHYMEGAYYALTVCIAASQKIGVQSVDYTLNSLTHLRDVLNVKLSFCGALLIRDRILGNA